MNMLSDLSKFRITGACNSPKNSNYTKLEKWIIRDTLRNQLSSFLHHHGLHRR